MNLKFKTLLLLVIITIIGANSFTSYGRRSRVRRETRNTPTYPWRSEFIPDWAEGMTDREIELEIERRIEESQRQRRSTYVDRGRGTNSSQERQAQKQLLQERNALSILSRKIEQMEKRVEQLENSLCKSLEIEIKDGNDVPSNYQTIFRSEALRQADESLEAIEDRVLQRIVRRIGLQEKR